MTKKLSFSVENAEMINENPDSNFAVLSLDFFASGENLHDMYVSEDTLLKTADSIKNCPLVWKYDETLDDVYTHDKDEVPCGFVPETSTIQNRKLDDGRTMLSVVAYVWKRYTGEILKFFKRDGGKKPVSVEMSVFGTKLLENGLTELLDFRYEGITVLGSFVTPAIPLANATVLSFADMKKEYDEVFLKEFTIIPEEVKLNAKKGLELKKENNQGITSVDVSSANYLIKNKTISPEKARQIVKYFSTHKNNSQNESVDSLLWGGLCGYQWAKSLIEKIDKEEEITINFETDKNSEKMEINMEKEEEKKVEEMAEDTAKSEEKETPEEEKKESPAEEKKEEEKGIEKKFEFPRNIDTEKMSAMFADDEDEEAKMAKEELKKGLFADPSVVMSAMFSKMCKMAESFGKIAEENKAYMAENEGLKKFKADMEMSQKTFAVEKTIQELSEKVVIPDEAKEEMLAEAEKYTFAELEGWKTYCKAKSFEFAIKETGKSDVVRVGLPFTGTTQKKSNDLWS